MYQARVQRVFQADHAIRLPDGTLEPGHGHDWSVRVTVARSELDEIETVMDFHELQRLVDALIVPASGRSLNDLRPFAGQDGRLAISPTAERVAWWIGESLADRLPRGVRLVEVCVGEAPGCFGVYRPPGRTDPDQPNEREG